MKLNFKLTKNQHQYFAQAARAISEGIILGSSAAFFLPETFQLSESISISRYLIILSTGFSMLIVGGIIQEKRK